MHPFTFASEDNFTAFPHLAKPLHERGVNAVHQNIYYVFWPSHETFQSKLNSLASVIADDGKCYVDIRKHPGIAKTTFQKLGKVRKDEIINFETRKR